MANIRILNFNEKLPAIITARFKRQLIDKGHEVELRVIDFDWNGIFSNLEMGVIDAVAVPMDFCPLHLPGHICITALSERQPTHFQLLINKTDIAENELLYLPKNSTVKVLKNSAAFILKDLRPDLNFIYFDMKALYNANFDTRRWPALLPAWIIKYGVEAKTPDWLITSVQAEDIPPLPGGGFTGYLTLRDNLQVRRILNQLHNRQSVALSNVERKVQRQLEAAGTSAYGVHARKNETGNFQVWASLKHNGGQIKTVLKSSSTFVGLAEQVAASLLT